MRVAVARWPITSRRSRYARPHLPDELDDRAQDCWEPLLAIADLAGGDWPGRARVRGAQLLSTRTLREDDSLSARLLADIYAVFDDERRASGSGPSDLIDELCEIEESPWGDWYGKTISPQALSKLLRPYRIQTMPVWVDGKTVRGYKAEQFAERLAPRTWALGALGSVRSGSSIEAAPNPPNPPNPQGATAEPDGIETEPTPSAEDGFPLLGDEGFPTAINDLWPDHLTSTELHELHRLHALVARAREAT